MKKKSTSKSSNEEQRYTNIILEQMRDQIQIVAEGQISLRDELMHKIDTNYRELKADNAIIQKAIKAVHDELKSDIGDMRSDLNEVKEDVKILKEDVTVLKSDVKVLKEDMNTVKTDMKNLSTKMDPIVVKIEEHDQDIAFLKSAS
ncbi:MAG: hypothetical protein A3I05_02520 [Deltaproteobacteria bacterium RIFCSPLOWO2_02_FULL_44_10]|nr:MAG: hypothetical protein A3C46_01470 [Deltaproteobacteria bacterium RIFCSPHIGHO2_02_FULL_44_16]OGQ45712.1 MAG: hypothetical protein A3I05_02520 [Deltaproteobacteria bacterium RIFCSPLOWO2_02_FULL_44_10]